MPKKKPSKRKPRPDSSQLALQAVERAIGGKLSDGMSGMGERNENDERLARTIKKLLKDHPNQTCSILDMRKELRLLRVHAGRGLKGAPDSDAIRRLVRKHRWFELPSSGVVRLKIT
jgi:hypothetical protein